MIAAVVILLIAPGLVLLVGTVVFLATAGPRQPAEPASSPAQVLDD